MALWFHRIIGRLLCRYNGFLVDNRVCEMYRPIIGPNIVLFVLIRELSDFTDLTTTHLITTRKISWACFRTCVCVYLMNNE